MQIGKLRHRVTIQSYTEARDSYGEPIRTWTDGDTVWAQIEPLSGRERLLGSQVVAETDVRVWMRHRTITTADRLSYDGYTFEIQSVRNVGERDKLLELLCKVVD